MRALAASRVTATMRAIASQHHVCAHAPRRCSGGAPQRRAAAPKASTPEEPPQKAFHLSMEAADAQLGELSPEAMAEVQKLAAAEARVAAARAAVEEFEQRLAADGDVPQGLSAAQLAADDEVARAQADLEAAAAAYELANAQREAAQQAFDAAGSPLSLFTSGGEASGEPKWAVSGIDDTAERVESAKAAVLAGVTGFGAALPLSLAASSSVENALISTASVAVSTALMGVVWRYALRRDMNNPHLKGGVIGAFGLTRGVAQADTFLAASAQSSGQGLSFVEFAQASLLIGEAMVTFALVGAVIDATMRRGLLSPFPKQN